MNPVKTSLVRSNNLLPIWSTTYISFDELVATSKKAGYIELEYIENDNERAWCGSCYRGSEQFVVMHFQKKTETA
jgi:hypothetical protein